MISNVPPSTLKSSAPASMAASAISSASSSPISSSVMTALLSKIHATDPDSPRFPPPRENAAKALAARSPVSVLTWPGFQMTANGSRFFLQTTSAPMTENRPGEGRYEVLIKNARTHVRNTRRWLDTRFFATPVRRARIERRGRHDLAFVFELREAAVPSVTSQPGQDGYTFLCVDFPPASAPQ